MTNSMSPRDPDAILNAWLEEGPNQLPETTRRAIAVGLRSTRPTRRVLDVPWRPNAMNSFARLAVAAAAIVIVAGGAFYVLSPANQGVGGPTPPPERSPQPSPSASPSPSAATSAITEWQTVTSDRFGYQVEIPAGWMQSAPIDDLPDEMYPGKESALADRWDPPVLRSPWLIIASLDPAPETFDEWQARNMTLFTSFCDVGEPSGIVVGGEPATRVAYICPGAVAGDVAFMGHDGLVYSLELGGAPRDTEVMAETLDHVLASFTFTE